jgi:F420-dependent oxidoreductase-like protein
MFMVRFGSFLPQGWLHEFADWEKPGSEFNSIKKVAVECEKLKYDSVWLYDHFITYPDATQDPCFESWTTLSAVASITENVGLGTLVTCNSYRYPSVLAKISATLDAISEGRLNFGIGAGWYKTEYNAYGIPFPKASVRIAQLGEAVQIIKKMWTEQEPTFHGKYFAIEKAICSPKPIQKPHPPILIGGRGRKLTLRTVAEFADRCNFGGNCTLEEYRELLARLNAHCDAVGRNANDIEKTHIVDHAIIGKNKEEVKKKINRFKPNLMSTKDYEERNLVGTPEQIISKIQGFVDVGFTYFIMRFPDMIELEPLRVFAQDVFPGFK